MSAASWRSSIPPLAGGTNFDFSQVRFRETEMDVEGTLREMDRVTREAGTTQGWLDGLSDEDLMFVKRFVLASGSLKDLAASYGISYPTVRLRLDRLIQKVQLLDDHRPATHFERQLRAIYADGRIDLDTLKTLLVAHEQELGERP
jgi:hypothetical protein